MMDTGGVHDLTTSAPMPRELDRATLVRCRAGDPVAFRAFVVRYERPVHAVLSRMLGHGPHVEDLAQETFLRAFDAFDRFDVDAGARPSTWLLTIATRLGLDARKRRNVASRALALQPEEQAVETPAGALHRAQLRRELERALEAISDDQRAALALVEFHDFSVAEVAEALGVAQGTVKSRLMRAREKLRALLAPLWEDS
jgi:RNA polymerase sigma-70 factor, ECF subfamily